MKEIKKIELTDEFKTSKIENSNSIIFPIRIVYENDGKKMTKRTFIYCDKQTRKFYKMKQEILTEEEANEIIKDLEEHGVDLEEIIYDWG